MEEPQIVRQPKEDEGCCSECEDINEELNEE